MQSYRQCTVRRHKQHPAMIYKAPLSKILMQIKYCDSRIFYTAARLLNCVIELNIHAIMLCQRISAAVCFTVNLIDKQSL